MITTMVSKLPIAAAAAAGLFLSGVGLPTPLGSGVAAPLGSCPGPVGVATAQPSSTCEEARDSCLDMNRAEDVWGNGYIPADAYHTCMQGYWDCKGQEG